MNEPFCRAKFNRAVRMSSDKSSPDLDGIDYRMLKNLLDRYRDVR